MGYRAHVVTQHRKYGSEIFSDVFEFEGYHAFMRENFEKEMEEDYVSEQEDYYEIPRVAIEAEIERLKALPMDETNEHYSHYTNQETIEEWNYALNEAPKEDDHVTLEWF